jgi:hypothetical protein
MCVVLPEEINELDRGLARQESSTVDVRQITL